MISLFWREWYGSSRLKSRCTLSAYVRIAPAKFRERSLSNKCLCCCSFTAESFFRRHFSRGTGWHSLSDPLLSHRDVRELRGRCAFEFLGLKRSWQFSMQTGWREAIRYEITNPISAQKRFSFTIHHHRLTKSLSSGHFLKITWRSA